jgi:hypothetical protein
MARNETYEHIISALLVAFEAPPLPLMALRGDANSDAVVSSHDLLYTMLNVQLNRCTVLSSEQVADITATRTNAQTLTRQHARDELLAVPKNDVDKVYAVFCNFSRQHLQTYADTAALDARFMPAHEVCPDTPIHNATKAHLAAALTVRGVEPSFESAQERLQGLRYTQLILVYADLLW